MNNFKLLFIFANTPLMNPPPVSLGIFTALLKPLGVTVKIFDNTFYPSEETSDKTKERNLQVRPFEFDTGLFPTHPKTAVEDLRDMIREYQPDLVAASCLECTWFDTEMLLNGCADLLRDIPVLVGGIFPTHAPNMVFNNPVVDMICQGEGERSLVELCTRMVQGKDYSDIPNLWIRRGREITRNPVGPVISINDSPLPDYSAFHKARFLRPMAGRIYRTVPVETNRGCPYSCSFCNSPSTNRFYKEAGAGVFFRKKTLERIHEELAYLIKQWDAEYVYFPSDTFLAMTDKEFDKFIEIYSDFKLPFWIQSRAETMNPYRAKKLKEIGCHRMSIGLEHGNEEFRKTMLKKRYTNEQMIRAANALADAGIPLSVNNILGFPEETRELVFDTIELNRQIPFDSTNANAFTPFHGTPLHEYCVSKGWIDPKHVVGCPTMDTPLDMPQFPRSEVDGLRKVFALYCRMPKEYWPDIERAEKDDEEGRRLFAELSRIYTEKFFKQPKDL